MLVSQMGSGFTVFFFSRSYLFTNGCLISDIAYYRGLKAQTDSCGAIFASVSSIVFRRSPSLPSLVENLFRELIRCEDFQ